MRVIYFFKITPKRRVLAGPWPTSSVPALGTKSGSRKRVPTGPQRKKKITRLYGFFVTRIYSEKKNYTNYNIHPESSCWGFGCSTDQRSPTGLTFSCTETEHQGTHNLKNQCASAHAAQLTSAQGRVMRCRLHATYSRTYPGKTRDQCRVGIETEYSMPKKPCWALCCSLLVRDSVPVWQRFESALVDNMSSAVPSGKDKALP